MSKIYSPDDIQREIARLSLVADQWECQKLHEQYWYHEATHDPEAILELFTEDAQYGPHDGKAAIRKYVSNVATTLKNVFENFHVIPVIPKITINGDTATGEVRGVAFIRLRKPDGSIKVVVLGVGYEDEFHRTPEGWRIAKMRGIECGFDDMHDTTWRFEAEPAGGSHESYLEKSHLKKTA
jgi:hypothetical protein